MSEVLPPAFDAVDRILAQWEYERPDLDCSPMGPIGRIKRCSMLLEQKLQLVFDDFGLCAWEFDMLAALRRSGTPYCLSPTDLFSTLMVTSGTMTHRLKRLENRGLITRVVNSRDARSMLVKLSEDGKKTIDCAVEKHVNNEMIILKKLSIDDLHALERGLSALLHSLE